LRQRISELEAIIKGYQGKLGLISIVNIRESSRFGKLDQWAETPD
jgi:hypothetical protein